MLRRIVGKKYREIFRYKSTNYSLIFGKPGDKIFNFDMKNIGISPQNIKNNLWDNNNIFYEKEKLIKSYPQLCNEITSSNNITSKDKKIWLSRYYKFTKMNKDKIPDLIKVHTSRNTGLLSKLFTYTTCITCVGSVATLVIGVCTISGPIMGVALASLCCSGISIAMANHTFPRYYECECDGDIVYFSSDKYTSEIKNNNFDEESDDLGYMFEQAINRIENNDKYVQIANKQKELNDMSDYEIEQMLIKYTQTNKNNN